MKRLALGENAAVLIYLMLLSCIAAVLLAWRMLPKPATAIEITEVNAPEVRIFNLKNSSDQLRYKVDEETFKVYYNGEIILFPMANIRTVSIQP